MESAFRRALGDVQNKMLSIAYGLIKREKNYVQGQICALVHSNVFE
jgi:hypothetical protein